MDVLSPTRLLATRMTAPGGQPVGAPRPPATEAGVKGDTAGSATKLATLETGHEVQVPLFIKVSDLLKIDTRTGEYTERVRR